MRQLATGADGAGYLIDYAMREEPEDLQALKMDAIKATDGSEEKQNKIRAYQAAAKEWADGDGSKGAYLIVDAKLVGVFDTGKLAREAAQKMEPETKPYSTPMTVDDRTTEMTFPRGRLLWRTE